MGAVADRWLVCRSQDRAASDRKALERPHEAHGLDSGSGIPRHHDGIAWYTSLPLDNRGCKSNSVAIQEQHPRALKIMSARLEKQVVQAISVHVLPDYWINVKSR